MSELLEVCMLLCFGVSWPISIRKSIVSRTAKGKSLVFECFILAGYLCGIASKLISQNVSYVIVFYIINLVTVSIDAALYFRNRRLDRELELRA